ncbi:GNAT family N-acetyltransferase [Chitinophaga arvensicola]|uniref:Ribosomal protein S18 acetylase RimI n=1 Tax=Chitinophaga arvensicola TaxID=29529 RepID=A0A1I0S9Z1_9BACT|nr:GNAT family N-acetyltransferase [Chitinophaga arvensicola]SEW53089.1 Ribosomal protein S18 acetylase RimI [Chitinophaga arvensicola]
MDTNLIFRLATRADLPAIVDMLADDVLGADREITGPTLSPVYEQAFEKISQDPQQELTVATLNGEVVATYQMTYIQYLAFKGGMRAQIEAVRTHSAYRGQGIGTKLFRYAIQRAREKGCHIVQLTSDKKRKDAIRFYESLGFVASHEGLKLRF